MFGNIITLQFSCVYCAFCNLKSKSYLFATSYHIATHTSCILQYHPCCAVMTWLANSLFTANLAVRNQCCITPNYLWRIEQVSFHPYGKRCRYSFFFNTCAVPTQENIFTTRRSAHTRVLCATRISSRLITSSNQAVGGQHSTRSWTVLLLNRYQMTRTVSQILFVLVIETVITTMTCMARWPHILCSVCVRWYGALAKAARLFMASLHSQPVCS